MNLYILIRRAAFAACFCTTLFLTASLKADPLCTSWGAGLNICLPLTSLDGAYGYDFNAPEGVSGNQALLETQIATYKDKLSLTFGGAKSPSEPASPYLSITYGVKNPLTDPNNILATLRPGVFFGKDFSRSEYLWGLKASLSIF